MKKKRGVRKLKPKFPKREGGMETRKLAVVLFYGVYIWVVWKFFTSNDFGYFVLFGFYTGAIGLFLVYQETERQKFERTRLPLGKE
jgi:hypothetical protein